MLVVGELVFEPLAPFVRNIMSHDEVKSAYELFEHT